MVNVYLYSVFFFFLEVSHCYVLRETITRKQYPRLDRLQRRGWQQLSICLIVSCVVQTEALLM